jgi:hypothetical protein
MHNGPNNQPGEGTMATFARCTRTDGRQIFVNLDRVLSMERVSRTNKTVLGLSARMIDGETSIEVREEPQSLISESVTSWD